MQDSFRCNKGWQMSGWVINELGVYLPIVRGSFFGARPHVVRWRGDLARPELCLGSCVWNSTLGHMVQ